MEFNFTKSQLEVLQKLVEYPDDFKYPLGTIIASDDPDAVKDKGGQWDQIEDRFLLGAGSTFAVNTSAGNAIHKHTLNNGYACAVGSGDKFYWKEALATTPYTSSYYFGMGRVNSSSPSSYGISLGGSTDNVDNMPPYMAKYMWIKTKLQSELEGENV